MNMGSGGSRTEYWKSLGRKFCDFCKCWIADNRPSIEFHENGKRHKENVDKRLKEINKNTTKRAKEHKKFESDVKKMEAAALAAYKKDVEENVFDMTAQRLICEKDPMLQATTSTANFQPKKSFPQSQASVPPRVSGSQFNSELNKAQGKGKSGKRKGTEKDKKDQEKNPGGQKLWYEARGPEGYSYFWNIQTNESTWEPPEEGYMTIDEQAEEVKSQEIQEEFFKQIDEEQKVANAEILEEKRANEEREKLKAMRKEKIKIENTEVKDEVPYLRDYSVPEKHQPYGAWKAVETKVQAPVNLQLPEKKPPVFVPTYKKAEPPALAQRFQEKTVTCISTDSEDESSQLKFKKRKLGKKNVRTRTTDD